MSDKELDSKVAEFVMGWRKVGQADGYCHTGWAKKSTWADGFERDARVHALTWSPSSKVEHAFEVVEKMRERFGFTGKNGFTLTADCEWYCEFPAPGWGEGRGQTAGEAICRAALDAIARTSDTPTRQKEGRK